LPYLAIALPAARRAGGSGGDSHGPVLSRNATMQNTDKARPDPDAELRGFEPLRVALALGALLLGLVLSIH
jgi:hypothetical protein